MTTDPEPLTIFPGQREVEHLITGLAPQRGRPINPTENLLSQKTFFPIEKTS